MDKNRKVMLDKAMLNLFKLRCHTEIGMPAWAVRELISRKSHALTPDDIVGRSERYQGRSMLEEHEEMRGYLFSWGTLCEINEEVDEGDECGRRFEFVPKDLLLAFPQPAMLEDLISWMYQYHPLRHLEFESDESYGDWAVMSFSVYGEFASEKLRRWIARVFVPTIWPELLQEAMVIVEKAKAAAIAASPDGSYEHAFVERERYQLCGDPAELSFFRDPS